MRAWILAAAALLWLSAAAIADVPSTTTTVVENTTTTEPTTTTEAPTTTTEAPSTIAATTTTTTLAPGGCDPANPAICDDGDPCTLDSCDAAFLSCTHRPLDGTPCADEGVFCTEDRCEAGVCQHRASDMLCDGGDCVLRVCDPASKHADAQGCVLVKGKRRLDGAPCTDDGFACTDDACMKGVCLHFPIGTRCLPQGVCAAAVCAPGDPDRDQDGCAVGPARAEGEKCADDGDACTVDVCRAGACAHEAEPDTADCSPVRDAFRQTNALGTLAGELRMELSEAGPLVITSALARLAAIEGQLGAAAAALDGHTAASPALAIRPAEAATIPVTERARIAFTLVLKTPRDVQAFLQTVAQARAQAALQRPIARHVRRRGRALLRSTRTLRAHLRTLAG